MTLAVLGTAVLAAVACSSTLQGSLNIITGPDDGFAQNPQPTSLLVQLIDSTNTTTNFPRVSLPSDGGITLPAQSGSNVDIIQITGFDDAGDAVVSGSTIPVALDQLSGITLNVFVQRTGQFSRLPSADGGTATFALGDGGGGPLSKAPLLTQLFSRYLLIADGTGKSNGTQLYDTLTWQFDPSPPVLPTGAVSMAYVDTYTGGDAAIDGSTSVAALLSIGSNNTATWLDLTATQSPDADILIDAAIPTGGTYADVAGGQTIVTPTNTYIVGATRLSGGATNEILRISPSGVTSYVTLLNKRQGATAVYVGAATGSPSNVYTGLYVFGGSAAMDGGDVPGAEFIGDGQSGPHGLAIPADTTTGAGGVAFEVNGGILLAGGVLPNGHPAPTRFYSVLGLQGAGDAGATTWPSLPSTFVTAQAFAVSDTTNGAESAIIVATEKAGTTLSYLLTPTAVTPITFRVPRSHGAAALLPNGALAVVGGDSGTVESFIP